MNTVESIKQKRSRAGKLGARRRYELYGNPGTPEGRLLGGKISSTRQRKNLNSPFTRKKIHEPPYSADFAECVGIILGDGGITSRQLSISLHKKDDFLYSKYVVKPLSLLFRSPITVTERNNVLILIISRTELVAFLESRGMRKGNKVKKQVQVPAWVSKRKTYIKRCIRGLIDTDGCLYVDVHKHKNTVYKNIGLNFTNRSLPILNFVKDNLLKMGYHPTHNTRFSIFLRREREVMRYMKEIGTSNKKIENKLESYVAEKYGSEKYGRVPKRS